MFKIGDYVVYGNTGICRVEDITSLNMNGSEKEYYVLVPAEGNNSRSFLPVDNTKVVIRPVLTKEQAMNLIDDIESVEEIDAANDKAREEKYRELAKKCDCRSWVSIIKTIYVRKKDRIAQGKKATATDDRYFKLAEDSLYSELGFAIGVDKNGMEEFIRVRLEGGAVK